MAVTRANQTRLYPIGALSAGDVAGILANATCKEPIDLATLMNDWTAKSAVYQNTRPANPNALDTDVQQFHVSANVQNKIRDVLASYRIFLQPTFTQGYIPIEKIITPQKSVIIERARALFGGTANRLSDDDNAEFCLGTPITPPVIDIKFLGIQQAPNELTFNYQFSALDDDIRPIPPNIFQPFVEVDWSSRGSPHRLKLNSVAFTVGPGASPLVTIAKIPLGPVGPNGAPAYRLVLMNGVHRVFRLAELGNTHVAAIVYPANLNEIPQPLVDTPREALLAPRPLMIRDFLNANITKTFAWERVKVVFKLGLTMKQERLFG